MILPPHRRRTDELANRRDNGRMIGGSRWERGSLWEATTDAVRSVRAEETRMRLHSLRPEALSVDQLERIAAILDEEA